MKIALVPAALFALLLCCACSSAPTRGAIDATTDAAAAPAPLDAAADEPTPEAEPVDAGSCCVWFPQVWFPGDGPVLVCKPRASVLAACPDAAF
jgi:hypothetical protein